MLDSRKVDVTCIYDSRIVNQKQVAAVPDLGRDISGGEVLHHEAAGAAREEGFQLRHGGAAEEEYGVRVLPHAPETASLMELPEETTPLPTAAAAPRHLKPVDAARPPCLRRQELTGMTMLETATRTTRTTACSTLPTSLRAATPESF